MSRKVRVLATTTSANGQRQVVYAAEIYDDEDAGWADGPTCEHNHRDLESAYMCALRWIANSDVKRGGRRTARPKPSAA